MKIALLSSTGNGYQVRRLNEELQLRGITPDNLYFKDIYARISEQKTTLHSYEGFDYADYDIIIPRVTVSSMTPYLFMIALEQQRLGKYVLNERYLIQNAGYNTKLHQYVTLSSAHVPIINTIAIPGTKFGQEQLDKLDVHFPLVAKRIFGSQGLAVHLVNNLEDIQRLLAEYGRGRLLLQPFVQSDFDLRIIVIGKKVLGAMKRIHPQNDFRNNYSLGGSVENFPLSDEIINISVKAAEVLGMDFCGVDLIIENGQYKVLEVNLYPQFKGFEDATGVNVAKALIDFVLTYSNLC